MFMLQGLVCTLPPTDVRYSTQTLSTNPPPDKGFTHSLIHSTLHHTYFLNTVFTKNIFDYIQLFSLLILFFLAILMPNIHRLIFSILT